MSQAQVDMSQLDVVKVSGNVYEVKGRLLTVIDPIGTLVKVFIPEDTPIYVKNDAVDFEELNTQDAVSVYTHDKNVALAIDITNNLDVTPTPEPTSPSENTSDGQGALGEDFKDISEAVGSGALRISIAATAVFLGIVAIAFVLPWAASQIGDRMNKGEEE